MLNKRIWEQCYPFTIPVLLIGLYFIYAVNTSSNLIIQKFSDLINISLILSGISLGFLGTMISAVLSITNSKVIRLIYEHNADRRLMRYIREAAVINLLVLLFSMALMLISNMQPADWALYSWLYIFISSFFCSFRIIHLLFALLEAVNHENRNALQQRKIYNPDPQNIRLPDTE